MVDDFPDNATAGDPVSHPDGSGDGNGQPGADLTVVCRGQDCGIRADGRCHRDDRELGG